MSVVIEKAGNREGWFNGLKSCFDWNGSDEENVRQCVFFSPFLWRGLVDDKVACMWGLVPPTMLSNTAYLWLITTKHADEHQFLLVRYSQRMIEVMLKEFPTICGHTAVGNTRAIRWLKWLGASFGEMDRGFIRFTIRKKDGGSD